MSGVYLTVWDNEKPFNRVLQPTEGGWPHITVAYTGSKVTNDGLRDFAATLFDIVMQNQVTLTRAYVNSFQYDSGEWRHDCLLEVDNATTARVDDMRKSLKAKYPEQYNSFSTNDPHVTVGI